jgi:hypothetical protein
LILGPRNVFVEVAHIKRVAKSAPQYPEADEWDTKKIAKEPDAVGVIRRQP